MSAPRPQNNRLTESVKSATTLRVGGQSFRCDCRCNVFHEVRPGVYECNACRAWYAGDDAPVSRAVDGAEKRETT